MTLIDKALIRLSDLILERCGGFSAGGQAKVRRRSVVAEF